MVLQLRELEDDEQLRLDDLRERYDGLVARDANGVDVGAQCIQHLERLQGQRNLVEETVAHGVDMRLGQQLIERREHG